MAMEIEYCAVLRLLERLEKRAREQGVGEVADCLGSIKTGAPKTTYEALQCMYIFFMMCESVDNLQTRSVGNGIDQSLWRFYDGDIKSGRYTRNELLSYLSYFFMQFSAIGSYWGQPMYIGGTDLTGASMINDLSYAILDIYEEFRLYNPKVQVKVNYNTPKDFIYRVYDLIRSGVSSFVICCEPGFVKAIMSYGATYEEACNFEVSGCYESRVKYRETSAIVGWINPVKALMYAINNGIDETTGKPVGVRTGDAESFSCFEDFYGAFRAQLKYLIGTTIRISNELYDEVLGEINPSLMYSGTNLDSLTKGVDGYAYANKYNNSAIEHCGLGSCVDCLMAVKEFVYDKRLITMSALKDALKNNWAGYEKIRYAILKSPHKFGNGDPLSDRYAHAVCTLFATEVSGKPNKRGGVFVAELHSARQFILQGKLTGATPDGRLAGEELSKNASAVPGMDINGVTALIKTATNLVPYLHSEGCCLDVMLHPSTVSGDKGLSVMDSLVTAYMNGGGMSIHFNVFDEQTLRDAQEHPERHKNLQVRVCGWNTLWNNMTKEEQEAYILRCHNIKE